ncbi:hypothetical protein MPSEU_000981200 [Mayamaea pseudoterrestris]|nr:hypothetical protein MPSEU_000981200 [Mayamaea pseudoterrestris]
MSSPFTPEQITEWASFGPKLKGKPSTPEEIASAQTRKKNCTAMKQRLAAALGEDWTEKKIEKELDRLVEEAGNTNASNVSARPAYLDAPSGTRDFYPADYRLQQWLFQKMRDTASLFCFQEYDAPVLEHVALYERKAGEEIVGQLYAFEDQEGDRVTLRPEMTPTLARMVLNKTNLQTGEVRLPLPLKWYSLPQCWRFETTQRGRRREHYQWNMDVVGVDHVHAELELLAAACQFFRSLGVGPDIVGIKVNSRAVLEALLAKHGITKGCATSLKQDDAAAAAAATATGESEDIFAKACVIIDKLDKIGGAAVTELLAEIGVNQASAQDILTALQAPTIEDLQTLIGGESSPAVDEVKRLFELAHAYNIYDYLIFDASVVRGLSYYTGIVWEAFDRKGMFRAIMGGGRYDRLLELYGGERCQIPCVGFGFGDCVIMELLKEHNLLPQLNVGVDYVVCAFQDDLYGAAADIAARLRTCNWSVDLMPTPKKKVANSFKHADQMGARRMVFVAPDEIARGVVRVKDLRTKDAAGEAVQVDCPLEELAKLDEMIAAQAGSSVAP